ncbi:MAG: ATP-binding protein [Thermoanaerobaculia bacterium]
MASKDSVEGTVAKVRTLRHRLGLTSSRYFTPEIRSPAARFCFAAAITLAALAIYSTQRTLFGSERFLLFGFAAVVLSSWMGRLLGGLVATAGWTLAAAYYFLSPFRSPRIERPDDALSLSLFVLVCLVIALLAEGAHVAWRGAMRMAGERQHLAEELLRERNRLELLFANLPGLVFELRVRPDEWPPHVQFVSANAARLTGIPADQWPHIGVLWERLLPELERAGFEEAVRLAIRRGTANHDHLWQHADGVPRSFHTHLSSRPARVASEHIVHGVSLDVTALGDAERAIAETERRFRSAADRAPIMIWIARPEVGNVWCNRAWLDFRGRPMDQELGAGWREGLHPEDAPRIAALTERAYAAREEFRAEFRIRRADGAWRWVLSVGVPRNDIQDRFQDYLGFCIDMSESKQIELEREELLRATDLAREQAELATLSKDEFLAKVSHELRNPLNGILGWTQILAAPDSTEDEVRRGISLIDTSARTLARLVDDLLDFSRILSGKLSIGLAPTDLEPVVATACEEIRPVMAARGVAFDCAVEGPLPLVLGDATRLHQVLWNLLSNAAKFTPRGGRVEVAVRRDDSDVVIEVSDTGDGIDAEFLSQVFVPFRQSEAGRARGHQGLGLGLSIVSQLVERHGGSVRAESPGQGLGSRFTVRLPVPAEIPAGGRDRRISNRRLDGTRVLVVDDDSVAREMLSALLARAGAEVSAHGSAPEARAALLDQRPDVLVSDIEMPGEDGLSLIRQVRERSLADGGSIPAVALTAHAQPADREAALAAGFQEHLTKPINGRLLLETISRLTRGVRDTADTADQEAFRSPR